MFLPGVDCFLFLFAHQQKPIKTVPQSAVREQHGHVIHAQDTGNQQADRYGQAQYLPQPVVSQDPPAGIGAGGLTIGEAHQQQVGGQYGQYAAYPQPQPDAAYPMQPITAPAAATSVKFCANCVFIFAF